MPTIQTEILVIGGGATGAGVAADLALRGFQCVLVEKRDLTHGTTGRYHGLLHSGGRYVVKDPKAATECIEENVILRKILPHAIEDTGGFFVVTPWDEDTFGDTFMAGCQNTGVPCEEISIAQMLKEEPHLNPEITRCFRVPDASADSFLATQSVAELARQHGAQILNYHEVKKLIRPGIKPNSQDKIQGALCHDLVRDEEVTILADMVVNAAGAWAGKIARTADLEVNVRAGKGTMLAANYRIINTVLNRCKMPADGDILVPVHTVSIIGTTDEQVPDPEHFAIEPWEVQLMMEEAEKLIPGWKDLRMLRCWAGVRPLYQETGKVDTRDMTRAYTLLDHETRDGVSGFITITGGKWTTYRQMAQVTVDLVCEKLGTERPCTTHETVAPNPFGEEGEHIRGSGSHAHHLLGQRLAKTETDKSFGQLICECELVTWADVENALTEGGAQTIDDIRRDIRVGMGPCQGGFCTFRVAGIWHQLLISRQAASKIRPAPTIQQTNVALRDFLQERWKGLVPILWGPQLKQERLDELIYMSVLNTDHLPGEKASPLGPALYKKSQQPPAQDAPAQGAPATNHQRKARPPRTIDQQPPAPVAPTTNQVLVIGAGLAGLTATWQAAAQGKKVHLISKGWGATHWHAGCVDVLGYWPGDSDAPVANPGQVMPKLLEANPHHPYAKTGPEKLAAALDALQELCAAAGYPMEGSLDKNWLLPSAVGAVRPTCLAPATMTAGDLNSDAPMLLVGFKQFADFYPDMVAGNLNHLGISARSVVLDIPALAQRHNITAIILAQMMEQEAFRAQVVEAIRPYLRMGTPLAGAAWAGGPPMRVGFPAVLGMRHAGDVHRALREQLGIPVFEIPGLPPSVPGIRLHHILKDAVERYGGRVSEGMEAVGCEINNGRIAAVYTETAARNRLHRYQQYVLATGGILGGGINTDHTGRVREVIFDLPLDSPESRLDWFRQDFIPDSQADSYQPLSGAAQGHPIYRSGIMINDSLQPTDRRGQVLYDNLTTAGTTLAGCDVISERAFDGVALATGYAAGNLVGN